MGILDVKNLFNDGFSLNTDESLSRAEEHNNQSNANSEQNKIKYRNCNEVKGYFFYNEEDKIKLMETGFRIAPDFTIEECNDSRPIHIQILQSAYLFAMGSVGGVFGSSAVYPLDFLKTRMQNVRKGSGEKVLYDGYWDCFVKTIRNEGVLGIYKGLVPQVCGVAPEKAIKLSTHAFAYGKLKQLNLFENDLYYQSLGGACAGVCQNVATQPLEIVKVRLQVAGESGLTLRARDVIRELGLKGLFNGFHVCMMRDVCFTSIYFPVYTYSKKRLADEKGANSPLSVLASGTMAAIPASGIPTPFDVIKTRIQVIPKPGDTVYNGLIDCATKLMKEEGMGAFWKGCFPRILRSAPQFGVTLFVFEMLQRAFPVDFDKMAQKSSEK